MAHPSADSGNGSLGRRPLCSPVIPLLNEEQVVHTLYKELCAAAQQCDDCDWEFVFVDDGSTDATFALLEELHARDPRVKCLRLSRNFGAHEATTAGLHYASGDAVIVMSGDLQDPPALFVSFIKEWRKGYDIVWAVREDRQDTFLGKLLAQSFYFMFSRLSGSSHAKKGSGSFFLMSSQVCAAYNRIRERNRATFELIHWLGFRQSEVSFVRPPRHAGKSKFSFGRRLKTAVDSLFSTTRLPVRLITYGGLVTVAFSTVYALSIILARLLGSTASMGWSSLMVTLLFLNGVVMVSLGILGEYMWRILDEARNRPLYIVREALGDLKPSVHCPERVTGGEAAHGKQPD